MLHNTILMRVHTANENSAGGPAPYCPEGMKWYKHIEPRLRCKHGEKYAVAKKKDKYWRLALVCLFVGSCLFGFQAAFEYFMPVMIVVLVGFVYAVLVPLSVSDLKKMKRPGNRVKYVRRRSLERSASMCALYPGH